MLPPSFYPGSRPCLLAKQEGAVSDNWAIVHGLIGFFKVFMLAEHCQASPRPLPARTPDGMGKADEPTCLDEGYH